MDAAQIAQGGGGATYVLLHEAQQLQLAGAATLAVLRGRVVCHGLRIGPADGIIPRRFSVRDASPAGRALEVGPDGGGGGGEAALPAAAAALWPASGRGALLALGALPSAPAAAGRAGRRGSAVPQTPDAFGLAGCRLLEGAAPLALPQPWSDACRRIVEMDAANALAPPPSVVVCGPKNAGKSTLARYLLNALLASNRRVVFLDADPGQCEFSPPGFGCWSSSRRRAMRGCGRRCSARRRRGVRGSVELLHRRAVH